MTPYGLKLLLRLDLERERMANEWFFKWHFIGRDGPVEIDSFDGRKLTYGGIKFSGTTRAVYWRTLQRYTRRQVSDIYDELETVCKEYPTAQALAAIEDVKGLLTSFLRQIAHDAVEKDRILRGNGIEFPPPDSARGRELTHGDEIERRAKALTVLIKAKRPNENPRFRSLAEAEGFMRQHKELIAFILVVGGAVGAALLELVKSLLG